MKKGEKRTTHKQWEQLLVDGIVKAEKTTLAATKKTGAKPSSVLVEIVNRVLKLPIEEPLKYPFPDDTIAGNFRVALTSCALRMGKDREVHISRGGATVYIYRVDYTS